MYLIKILYRYIKYLVNIPKIYKHLHQYDNNITMNYIYLLSLYPSNPDNIVKLGRTSRDFIERYNDYKCDTTSPIILFVYKCNGCSIVVEKELLIIFKNRFTLRKDFGKEYFTGNVKDMKNTLLKYFMDNDQNDISYCKPTDTKKPIDNNKSIEWLFFEDFLKNELKQYEQVVFKKIPTKYIWQKFDAFYKNLNNNNILLTSRVFHYGFKANVCSTIQKTKGFEDAILYSTKENRIVSDHKECYLFNIPKLLMYMNIQ